MKRIWLLSLVILVILTMQPLLLAYTLPGEFVSISTIPVNEVNSKYKGFLSKSLSIGATSNAFGYIDVYGPTKTVSAGIPSDWYDLSWKYRVRVWVNETYGVARPNQLITIHLTFPEYQCYVGTIIVIDNASQKIIPAQIWGATYYSAEYYKSVYISWITPLAPNEHKLFYVYWNDGPVSYSYQFTSDRNKYLVFSDLENGYHIENKYFEANFYINGGIDISVNGQLLAEGSLYYQPAFTNPLNATYIWLDSTTMYSGYSGYRDHLKIIAWYDDTRVKVYGYNLTTNTWEPLIDVTIDSAETVRYPPYGESPYNLTRIESNKPVSIFVGDLGSTNPNYYGVDRSSDDAFYSYFGTYAVLWVPRDLFVAAYYDNTHVKIIDTNEGDDSFEITLNKGEVWFHGMGDKRTYYGSNAYQYYDTSEAEEPSFFENDIVKIIADKPVTILAGYFSSDFFGMIRGHGYKEYVFPFFSRFTIVPLFDDTNVNIKLKFFNATIGKFQEYKSFSLNLNANEAYEVTDDPQYIKVVIAVDLFKNVSKKPVTFNVTILVFNETARRYGDTPYYRLYYTYLGTVTPTAEPGKPHYDEPYSGNWNETVVTLEGGKSYMIVLGWNGSDDLDLDLYVYWYGKSPLMDGTGEDFELQVKRNQDLGSSVYYGDFTKNDWEAFWYLATPVKSGVKYTGDSISPYSIELKHEEWGIAIVEADKPILIYTGTGYWGYEGTNGDSSYGGQFLFCGKVFDLAFPFQNRYLMIAAVEPFTSVRVWINGSVADWRSRSLSDDVRVVSPNIIQLDNISSWVNIPLPMKSRIHIEADKPVVVKVFHGWRGSWKWDDIRVGSEYYSSPEPNHAIYYPGLEELALIVLDPSPPIIRIEKIIEGPILTRIRISWGIVNNLIVEDEYTFIANISGFILKRLIRLPEYLSLEREIVLLGFKLTSLLATDLSCHNISLYPFTTVDIGALIKEPIVYNPSSNFILGVYNKESSLSISIGLFSLEPLGLSQITINRTISGYIYELEKARIYHDAYVLLEGGADNAINASYLISAGALGATIFSEASAYIRALRTPLIVAKGTYESTAIDVTIKVYDIDGEPIKGANITIVSSSKNVNMSGQTDKRGVLIFFDVPASDDYEITIRWTNTSAIFTQFPEAYYKHSETITGDTILEYKIAVKEFSLEVKDGTGELFSDDYHVDIIGKYIYGYPPQEEIIITASNIALSTGIAKFLAMPISKESGVVRYEISVRYDSAYGISTENSTAFVWLKTNTTTTISIALGVANLYIRALDLENTTLPGATIYLHYYESTFSVMANGSGIGVFEYLPYGEYNISAEYYGVSSSIKAVIFDKPMVVNITVPVKYGEKPAYISLSSELYEGYWGTTITVYAQFIDSMSLESVPANMSIWVIDKFTGEILISGHMINVTENTYAFEITLSGALKAGKSYIIQVTGYNPDYIKPAPANATLSVLPIPMIVDYPSRIEQYWGREVRIYVNITHTEEFLMTPVENAIVRAEIIKDNIVYRVLNLEEDEAISGYYWAKMVLDGNISAGVYMIKISIEKYGYLNVTLTYPLYVITVPTILTTNASLIDTYYGELIRIRVDYNRIDVISGVVNATVRWVLLDKNNNTVMNGSAIEIGGGSYVITVSTHGLMLESYLLMIKAERANFRMSQTYVTIDVNPIPTTVSVVPPVADITWGDDYNFTITVFNALNQSGIENISTELHVYVGGELIDVGDAIKIIEIGDGVYIIMVRSGLLNVSDYRIEILLAKQYYALPTVEMTARVRPVNIEVTVRTSSKVFKNPATGAATTKVEVILRESQTKAPITNAVVYVNLVRGEKIIATIEATESKDNPGVYVAYIDWSKVEPGDYTISVEVREITRNTYKASAAQVTTIQGVTAVGVSVDYLGGSTVIAGRRYPNLVIYPILLAIFAAIGFAGYWYYSWIRLPIEVREVIRLMKAIKKGKYEYPAPTREEAVREVLAEYLGIARRK